ncbi:hypothetical protein BXZ70DRAFT_581248 [Cristinia sonorae]|uniref:BIR-domain-containing protein n=1 Tax=Cristinia sonorae TaxID=1940300 RepID=A0A8K0UHA2_9AGAR|nr:hypothetical protein BXZ70DRAFT_581248 [Cristinia sonorae]
MDTLQGRLASFKSTKRSKSLTKSTSGTLKWPHPATYKATPSELAEAGFYWSPSAEYRDNVTCFMCEKELADWDKNDDPFAIHWDKCNSSCSWAMVRCSLRLDLDETGSYHFTNSTRLPSSKPMERARLETFTVNQAWPHDNVKGHGANSKKMAKAGFVYTPQAPGDDTATCFYCRISLSGWDADDDPLYALILSSARTSCSPTFREEHRKREERTRVACPFFSSTISPVPSSKPTGKAPPRVSSKPPSRTASHSKIVAPTIAVSESEGSSSAEEEPVKPLKSTGNSRAKKSTAVGSSNASEPKNATRRATRSKSTAKGKAVETSDDEETGAGGSDHEAGKKVSKAKFKGKGTNRVAEASEDDEVATVESENEVGRKPAKKTKGKANGKARMTVVQEEDLEPEEEVNEEPEPVKPKRGRPPSSKKAASSTSKKKKNPDDIEEELENEEPEPAAPPTKPKHTRTRSKANLEVDTESQPASIQSQPKPSTSKKHRTPAAEPHEDDTQPQSTTLRKKTKTMIPESEPPAPAPTKGRTVSKSKTKTKVVVGDSDDELAASIHEQAKETTKPVSSSRAASAQRTKQERNDDPRSRIDKGQTKTRKSSSTSDDAGYATAELPMDVDIEEEEEPRRARHPKQNQEDVVMIEGYDRDSGLAESVGLPSPPHAPSSLPKPTIRLVSQAEPVSSGSTAKRDQTKTTSSPTVPYNEPPHVMTVNNSKGKGKGKLQAEVLVASSSHKRPTSLTADDMDTDAEAAMEYAESHSESLATPPPATSSSSPQHPAGPSTPTSKTVQFLPDGADPPAPSGSETPQSIVPLLGIFPMVNLTSLTEEESAMTIEQYIRREIDIQYQQFKEDGERRIALFKERAAETRRIIEAS